MADVGIDDKFINKNHQAVRDTRHVGLFLLTSDVVEDRAKAS